MKNLLEKKDASSDIFGTAMFCLNTPVWHRVQEIARTNFQSIKSEKSGGFWEHLWRVKLKLFNYVSLLLHMPLFKKKGDRRGSSRY